MSAPSQDLPPPEGFGPIQYRRHLPKRGPPGWALLGGLAGIVLTGMLLHSKGMRIRKYVPSHWSQFYR